MAYLHRIVAALSQSKNTASRHNSKLPKRTQFSNYRVSYSETKIISGFSIGAYQSKGKHRKGINRKPSAVSVSKAMAVCLFCSVAANDHFDVSRKPVAAFRDCFYIFGT